MRNMSGAFGPGLDGEVAAAGSTCSVADAEDEERAQADGQQDDARLIAGPRDVQHRLPQRERLRVPQRLNRHARARAPARCSTNAVATKPRRQHQTHFERTRPATPRRPRAPPPHRPSPSISANRYHAGGGMSCRSSSDGLTCRTSSSGTSENSIDTSRPIAKPCTTADVVSPKSTLITLTRSPTNAGTAASTSAARCDAQCAAGESEQQHLHHINGQHLRRAWLPTHLRIAMLADLLLHEYPRDARNADATKDEDDEPHETQIVLCAREVFAHLVFGAAIPAHVDELVGKCLVQGFDRHLRGGRASPALVATAWSETRLPNLSRSVASRSARSMITRGPSVKAPSRRPGSAVITPEFQTSGVRFECRSPGFSPNCARSSGRTSAP